MALGDYGNTRTARDLVTRRQSDLFVQCDTDKTPVNTAKDVSKIVTSLIRIDQKWISPATSTRFSYGYLPWSLLWSAALLV